MPAGRRVEVNTARGAVQVSELTRPGNVVWSGRFMSARVIAVVEHPAGEATGRTYAHVAIDDHSSLAQVELRATQQAGDCVAVTRRLIAAYRERGTPIQRILTDNGSCYRSAGFAHLLAEHDIRHIRTAPKRPAQTAKQKPSSASCNGNRPTPTSTPQATTEPQPYQAGCAGTTTTDHTARSKNGHPPAASHKQRGPTSRPSRRRSPARGAAAASAARRNRTAGA
jgi:hypothetical protein